MVNKAAVTQVHTAARGKFTIISWRGLKWRNVFFTFMKLNKFFENLKEACTQTQTYKMVFVVRVMQTIPLDQQNLRCHQAIQYAVEPNKLQYLQSTSAVFHRNRVPKLIVPFPRQLSVKFHVCSESHIPTNLQRQNYLRRNVGTCKMR